MPKVILVVCDGLRDDTAADQMGYMEHLVERKEATRYMVRGELPTFSRPMYESLHTGLPTVQHGVSHNGAVRLSNCPNIFRSAHEHSMVTAAVAYSWFSELYNKVPYDRALDREVDDPELMIQHGRFYTEDDYPDAEVFATAEMLVRRFAPDYLLVHPMGMDHTGETYGSNSSQYRNKAISIDVMLAQVIPSWRKLGYNILVTADHGITEDYSHGGTQAGVRQVPLYTILSGVSGAGNTQKTVSLLSIAPTVCRLLAVPIPDTMKSPALV